MAERKARTGFAAMDPERQRELAKRGGRAVQEKGTGHRWDSERAKAAGHAGGKATMSVPGRASEMGKRGGRAKAERKEASP
jgi:general stress protein YciG